MFCDPQNPENETVLGGISVNPEGLNAKFARVIAVVPLRDIILRSVLGLSLTLFCRSASDKSAPPNPIFRLNSIGMECLSSLEGAE